MPPALPVSTGLCTGRQIRLWTLTLICGWLRTITAPFSLDLWQRLVLTAECSSGFHGTRRAVGRSRCQHQDQSPKRCAHTQSCYFINSRLMAAGAQPGTPDLASWLLRLLQGSHRSLCCPGKYNPPSFSGFFSLQHTNYFIARCLLFASLHSNTEKAEEGRPTKILREVSE